MNKTLTYIAVIFIILMLLTSYYLGYLHAKKNNIIVEKVKIDTIYKEIVRDPIVLEKIKTRIVYVKDTIIETKPFIASFDTIIKKDTIQVAYHYPENCLDLNIKSAPDSVITEVVYITKEVLVEKEVKTEDKSKWWHIPAVSVGSAVIGFILGGIK